MEQVRNLPNYKSNGDKLFAGEGCRVNGILAAYFSKDDYHYNNNTTELSYNEYLKEVEEEVEEAILSEAKLAWKHYFSFEAELPTEYETLKRFF